MTVFPYELLEDNGWGCDGRSTEKGCLSGITGFHQTKGMNRFRCERCDFDYCEKCYLLRTGAKLCLKGHELIPLGTTRDNGWSCNNSLTKKEDCLLHNKTKGSDRYRSLTEGRGLLSFLLLLYVMAKIQSRVSE